MKLTKITILFLFLSMSIFAQNGKFREKLEAKKEQIQSMKVAYITTELNLTSKEAESFWPIYNTFDDRQFEIRKTKLKGYLDKSAADNLSEKDASGILAQIDNTEDELYQLRKKFSQDLKNVLPATKILKLKKAEENFNKKLLNEIRNRRSK